MASNAQLTFAIRAMNESAKALKDVQGDIQGITDRAEKSKGPLGGFGSALGSASKIAGGFILGSGILQAPGFLFSAAQAAADDAASTAKLKQAVDNAGISYDSLKDSLDATIVSAQKKGFTDDQARNSLSLLTAQTGSAEEAQKRFTLAMDLSRGANIDLETASRLLGKVTEENVNVLARYGIKVQEGATETELFGALQEKFGGQAQVFADSTAGHMAQVKIQMDELKERIGTALIPIMAALGTVMVDDVFPALNKVSDWVELKVIPVVEDLGKKALPELSAAFTQLQQMIDGLMPIAEAILKWFEDNPAAIAAVTAALGILLIALFPIPAAILAITAVGVLLLAHWDDIKAKVDELVTKFQTDFPILWAVVEFVWNDIKNKIETTMNVIRDVIAIVMALIHGDWSAAWGGVKQLVNDIFDGLVTDIANKMNFIADVVRIGGEAIARAIANGVRDGWHYITDIVDSITEKLNPLNWDLPGLSPFKEAFRHAGVIAMRSLAEGTAEGTVILKGAVDGAIAVLTGSASGTIGGTSSGSASGGITGAILTVRDALRLLKEGFTEAAQAVLLYVAGLKPLEEALAAIEATATAAGSAVGTVTGDTGVGGAIGKPPPIIGTGPGSPIPKPTSLGKSLNTLFAGNEIWAMANAGGMTFEAANAMKTLQMRDVLKGIYGTMGSVGGAFWNAILQSKHIALSNMLPFFSKLATAGMSFDRGGWLMPGVTLAVNNTGRPERVIANGGGDIHIHINAIDGESVRRIAPTLAAEIQRHLRTQGAVGMIA